MYGSVCTCWPLPPLSVYVHSGGECVWFCLFTLDFNGQRKIDLFSMRLVHGVQTPGQGQKGEAGGGGRLYHPCGDVSAVSKKEGESKDETSFPPVVSQFCKTGCASIPSRFLCSPAMTFRPHLLVWKGTYIPKYTDTYRYTLEYIEGNTRTDRQTYDPHIHQGLS